MSMVESIIFTLGLLADYYNCQEISVNPAQNAPQSGFGVDGYFLTAIL
jgi:hypothetical protein